MSPRSPQSCWKSLTAVPSTPHFQRLPWHLDLHLNHNIALWNFPGSSRQHRHLGIPVHNHGGPFSPFAMPNISPHSLGPSYRSIPWSPQTKIAHVKDISQIPLTTESCYKSPIMNNSTPYSSPSSSTLCSCNKSTLLCLVWIVQWPQTGTGSKVCMSSDKQCCWVGAAVAAAESVNVSCRSVLQQLKENVGTHICIPTEMREVSPFTCWNSTCYCSNNSTKFLYH